MGSLLFHGIAANCLVQDATCLTCFAPSYLSSTSSEAGAIAALAEERKKMKYAKLNPALTFTPMSIETSGFFGPKSLSFLKDLGGHLDRVTREEKSTTYLIQRLAVAVQRGKAASVLGTVGQMTPSTSLIHIIFEYIFFFVCGCVHVFSMGQLMCSWVVVC